MTAQLASHLAQASHVKEQPYRARRQNWVNQLERHALMQPNATALRFLGNTVTWDGLQRRVTALADALSRRGVGFGDRVMILMLNRPEFIETCLAATMLGAIAVPVNFRLTPPELAYLVEDGGALARAMELAEKIAGNAPMTNFALVHALPRIAGADPATGFLMESLMAAAAQGSDEAKKRLRDFLEKRAPKIVNKG